MRRIRFQIRALMAVVAVVAIASGAGVLTHQRAQAFRERAYYHYAASHQLEMDAGFSFCSYGRRDEQVERKRDAERKLQTAAAQYHHSLSLKYQAAAAHPWYLVSSDPPAPPLANPRLVSANDY